MSDAELEALKRKRMLDLQRRMALHQEKQEKQKPVDAHMVLDSVFRGRAWEVFNEANSQYPSEMAEIEHELIGLVSEGKLKEIDGEQLFALLRNVGLRVSLNTGIKIVSHGKTQSLSEKFKEPKE
jgi:DNA-binding TFAR19-related protein (PDSD5 family)